MQEFVREPSGEEWEWLSVYAQRMRRLMQESVKPSEETLRLLNKRFSNSCMFPRLREARVACESPVHLELLLPLIVSPVLSSLHFSGLPYGSGPLRPPQLVPTLEALAPAYNSLAEIRICNPMIHDPRIIDAASTLLLKCNPDKLRYFHVDSTLSEEAFIHASQLPKLEGLTIRAATTELGVSLPTSMFPSLKFLEVNTAYPTSSPLLQAITRIQSKTFRRLELTFPTAASGTFLPETLNALRPRCLNQTLTWVTISPRGYFDLDKEFIRPLLFLTQLTRLAIEFNCRRNWCPYKLSDEDFEELVKTMPKLEELSLGMFPCPLPANNTVRSLMAIAKHCKHLNDLSIHINVEAIIAGVSQHGMRDDQAFGDPPSAFIGCPIRSITFGPCPIPNEAQGAMTFALMLARLFPLLNSVSVFPPGHERNILWDIVGELVTSNDRIGANLAGLGK